MSIIRVRRVTRETNIEVKLNLYGNGKSDVKCDIGFFKHLLESFSLHGFFDLSLRVLGDIEVDQHHTVEDTGIVLGQAFFKALEDRKSILRSGFFIFPMDEALSLVAIDISNRPHLHYDLKFRNKFIGELQLELIEDFFLAFANEFKCGIHIKNLYGRSDHHKAESVFKAFGRALKIATLPVKRGFVPSVKGLL
ncbi:MAG: imidazoleglycerol-phosphate dehydratase HisB [Deltaproteobacteria bacterium]|nr:imidazoleglycerol-phosphate dehydratase HisB [Deltaproteobacteria bacterium]